MCGILGSVNMSFSNEDLQSLAHRGPDDTGMHAVEVASAEVQLGQTRLAILDLSDAGHQPMCSSCGQYAIIFNGEIYNHLDLRKKLPNINYRGHSDTETLLHYLQHHGIKGVADLNGIFSLAFLDHNSDRLHLVRDPFGVKPLYYSLVDSHGLVFSSELKAMRAVLGDTSMNKDALATLLQLRYNPAPDTLFEGLQKVRPGHIVTIDLSKPGQISQSIFYGKKIRKKESLASDVVQTYGDHVQRAVQRQLLSDVEIGVFLSGGIDSAMVAKLAQAQNSSPLKAFTVGFSGVHAEDETEAAQYTASLLGLEHHIIKIDFEDFLTQLEECCKIVEEPLATTSIIPMYNLSKLASQHVKVVLTGQGADEPLGGYPKYRGELLQQYLPGVVRKLLPPILKWIGVKDDAMERAGKALSIQDELLRYLTVSEVFTPHEIWDLIGIDNLKVRANIEYMHQQIQAHGQTTVERMMALDARLNLADDLLNYTDKITMHFSMECRVPFLDLEFIQFVESLPRSLKLNLKTGKIVHKKYAQRILPHEIINRKKQDFKSPTQLWFRRESNTLREILLEGGTNFSQVFNPDAVSSIIDQHYSGFNRERHLFLLLSIYYWMKSL